MCLENYSPVAMTKEIRSLANDYKAYIECIPTEQKSILRKNHELVDLDKIIGKHQGCLILTDESIEAMSEESVETLTLPLYQLTIAYRNYIFALPDDMVGQFPAMDGVDGDWADEVIYHTKQLLKI